MKMFSDCAGKCGICACGDFCLAGHDDDDFYPATDEQIVERIITGQYIDDLQLMLDTLKERGVEF